MAQTSRRLRKLRRIKREKSLALRMAAHATHERDQLRAVLNHLAQQEKNAKREAAPEAVTGEA